MQYTRRILMFIMGRINRKIAFHEVQYLRKGETYETAFNNCSKKEIHRDYINVSDIPRVKHIDKCGADYKCLLNVSNEKPLNDTELCDESCK
ncbi:hypothetical protein BsWGS_19411 [Bradybaena similaris]